LTSIKSGSRRWLIDVNQAEEVALEGGGESAIGVGVIDPSGDDFATQSPHHGHGRASA
jgi:hypothetical protein